MTVTTSGPSTAGVSGGVAEPVTGPPRRRGRGNRQNQPIAYVYLFPIVVSALLFTVIPFAITLYYSFTNYGLLNFVSYDRIGLQNYRDILAAGGEFYPVLGWTFAFMTLTTLINVGFGMLLALLLANPKLPERNLYRTLLILPWALPFILLVQVFTGIFNNQGPVNQILNNIGLDSVQWIPNFGDPLFARIALLFVNLWFTYPFFMTVGIAALAAIPRDLYEVAELDGAGTWTKFRDITWPFLLTAVTPLIITQAAFQFNNAGVIILFTNGLPAGAPGSAWGLTDTLASYAYDIFYDQREYGLAGAYATVIFVFIALLLVITSLTTRSFKED